MTSGKVLIIGGGPSGLESARCVAELGGEAILIEKRERLGGDLRRGTEFRQLAGDLFGFEFLQEVHKAPRFCRSWERLSACLAAYYSAELRYLTRGFRLLPGNCRSIQL